jgi:glutamyl-tRNA reductase
MAEGGMDHIEKLSLLAISRQDLPPLLQESFFQGDFDSRSLTEELQSMGFGRQGREALILATCERLELYLYESDGRKSLEDLRAALVRLSILTPDGKAGDVLRGEAALRHLFALTASLMSEVLGEANILGQVKAALRGSREAGIAGPRLARLFQAAFAAAKTVRSQSGIAEQPVSMAAVALRLARQVQGDLKRCQGLLLGLGELGEFLAEEFRKAGLGQLTVVHPSALRAEAVAQVLGGRHESIDELPALLSQSDVVIAGLPKGGHGLDATMIERALQSRRRKPIFLLDVALPHGIDPAVAKVDDAYLFDADDLERLAMKGWKSREAARESAQALLAQEMTRFFEQERARQATPLVTALRHHFEKSREQALKSQGNDAAKATELLIKQLLHEPLSELRRAAGESEEASDEALALEEALRRLFPLDAVNEDDET